MSNKDVANFITVTSFDRLSANVVARAKVAIRDHLGVLLAAHDDKAVAAVRKVAQAMGGREESTLIGIGVKVPCNIASLVNAVMTRTLDMDDGAYRSTGHLTHAGGVVIPSSLAVAERQNATGKQLIEAVVVGYEVALRAGWIISLWGMFAPAGMAGTYGAAAAAAKLLGLSTEETADTLGVAEAHCLYPSRAKHFERTAMTKEAAGWGAMTGVTAALLAQAGFNGPETLFNLTEYNQEPLETLGKQWEIMGLYFKPYSSCRATHAPLDGVFELTKQHNLTADNIKTVTVGVSTAFATMFANYRPLNIWQAQFSIPFVIGAALTDGEVGPVQIAENRLVDDVLLSHADKVKLVGDTEVDALASSEGMRSCRVKIEAKDGREFETFVGYPRGSPQNPLSEEELVGKFRKLATRAVGTERTEGLIKCLNELENLGNINKLIEKVSLF